MIIPRGYGEPPTLAKGSLERSPKRKSAWIFQNVINSLFQQHRKETVTVLAAEEPGCMARSTSAATTPVKGGAQPAAAGTVLCPAPQHREALGLAPSARLPCVLLSLLYLVVQMMLSWAGSWGPGPHWRD